MSDRDGVNKLELRKWNVLRIRFNLLTGVESATLRLEFGEVLAETRPQKRLVLKSFLT
ncbi:hypothetical protein [Leptospira weilii]|uniref:hypothetical protein n=1 Tax=Leptospira weilii TaxID=28184 RepID=UPI0002BE4E83|nr:hypothetical protein [Leptospira weilii]EMN45600.1 hypothetical protein LEP1GSC086_2580 [Leptospira weilii str. LNT 1234]